MIVSLLSTALLVTTYVLLLLENLFGALCGYGATAADRYLDDQVSYLYNIKFL